MADIQHADPADEVQVTLPFDIPHLRTQRAVDHQRVGGYQAAWHELVTLTEEIRGFFTFAVHGFSQ
ncbi:hypothetical protein D3C80_2072490 [compost metagenome]